MTSSATDQKLVPLSALFADFDGEIAATRRMLERFPSEHADWKPHEKSMTLGRLASHVAELPQFLTSIATKPEFNAKVDSFVRVNERTADGLVQAFDRFAAEARAALDALDPATLDDDWRARSGDQVWVSGQRNQLLRRMGTSHITHHRGQLSVYYRLLGVPVPGMYGPSADEM